MFIDEEGHDFQSAMNQKEVKFTKKPMCVSAPVLDQNNSFHVMTFNMKINHCQYGEYDTLCIYLTIDILIFKLAVYGRPLT